MKLIVGGDAGNDKEGGSIKNFDNSLGESVLSVILPGTGYSACSVSSSVKWRQ